MDFQQEIIVGFGASMGFAIACLCFRLFRRRNIPTNTPLPPQQQTVQTPNPQPSAPQPYVVYMPNQVPPQQIQYPQTYPYSQTYSFPQTHPYPKQV